MNIISRRWAPEIILALAEGPRRFNRLLQIPNISDRVLTVRLRDLEDLGLVERCVEVGRPVRVGYALTEHGRRYVGPLTELAMLPGLHAVEVAGIAS